MRRAPGAVITISPTLDAGAYASGDVLFASTKLENVALDTKGLANLRTLVVLDLANQKQAIDFYFFSQDPGSVGAANSAFDLSNTQIANCIGRYSVASADYITAKSGTNAEATKLLEMLLATAASSKDVWVVGVCRSGTPTYGAAGLKVKFILEQL
jgi:hypothetical protein